VNSAVPDNGGLDTRAITAPKVNALDRSSLEGLASDKELGVSDERFLEIFEEIQMLLKDVVGVEV
jgi:hypothetical protein